MNKTRIAGHLYAQASAENPLQSKLSLIITDFEPNANGQGIPIEEKENIMHSALYAPLKINFTDATTKKHNNAIAVGPIIAVYEQEHDGRATISGDAIIWQSMFQDVAEYVKSQLSEGIGTSWEIYYETAEKDNNGIEWLHGCHFDGTCIVDVPAYGPKRTRILAIAETLMENLVTKELDTASASNTSDVITITDARETIVTAQDVLFGILNGLDELYNQTFDIEAQQIEKDLPTIAKEFASRISALSDFFAKQKASTAELKAELEQKTAALAEIAENELKAQAEQKLSARKAKLLELGLAEDVFHTRLSDADFELYVQSLNFVRMTKTNAEKKPLPLPEPIGEVTNVTTATLAAAILEEIKK